MTTKPLILKTAIRPGGFHPIGWPVGTELIPCPKTEGSTLDLYIFPDGKVRWCDKENIDWPKPKVVEIHDDDARRRDLTEAVFSRDVPTSPGIDKPSLRDAQKDLLARILASQTISDAMLSPTLVKADDVPGQLVMGNIYTCRIDIPAIGKKRGETLVYVGQDAVTFNMLAPHPILPLSGCRTWAEILGVNDGDVLVRTHGDTSEHLPLPKKDQILRTFIRDDGSWCPEFSYDDRCGSYTYFSEFGFDTPAKLLGVKSHTVYQLKTGGFIRTGDIDFTRDNEWESVTSADDGTRSDIKLLELMLPLVTRDEGGNPVPVVDTPKASHIVGHTYYLRAGLGDGITKRGDAVVFTTDCRIPKNFLAVYPPKPLSKCKTWCEVYNITHADVMTVTHPDSDSIEADLGDKTVYLHQDDNSNVPLFSFPDGDEYYLVLREFGLPSEGDMLNMRIGTSYLRSGIDNASVEYDGELAGDIDTLVINDDGAVPAGNDGKPVTTTPDGTVPDRDREKSHAEVLFDKLKSMLPKS